MTICEGCHKDCRITYTLTSIDCPELCTPCFKHLIISQDYRRIKIDKEVKEHE